MLKRWGWGVAFGAALVLGACSDSTGPVFERIETALFHESLNVDLDAMTRTDSGLYYQDLVVGDGALADPGSVVNVAYLLRYRSGATEESGEYSFEIDADEAIAGFNEGVRGMRVGGERKLVVPPELAYGRTGPQGILIFDIELLTVE
ncbi:MAG: FKBP-type peptidyl-prolyl cis-trans isomerase [Gemmatimonadota bacterium]